MTTETESSGLQMKYFVLKPAGDTAYGHASRKAMLIYARIIRTTNPKLAQDLEDWAQRELFRAIETPYVD